jgi:hypothetical protein
MDDVRDAPMIQDTILFQARRVSRTRGRRRLKELEARGEITPLVTPTGRRLLSIADAERLASAL